MRGAGRPVRWLLSAGFWYLAYVYLTVPDVRLLRARNPETTAFIEQRAAEAAEAGRVPVRRQHYVSYARISAHLKRAVLVAEDAAFWQHEGVDFEQIRESLETNLERGELARGGSTITQQLAKNLYLSPSKNPARKLRELLIARRMEAVLSKRRILELYLNEIEWGAGIYGAEAAARTYFGKSAAALEPDEAALLAAAITNPRMFDPGHPSARLRARQRLILRRMGAVTPPADTRLADTVTIDRVRGTGHAGERPFAASGRRPRLANERPAPNRLPARFETTAVARVESGCASRTCPEPANDG